MAYFIIWAEKELQVGKKENFLLNFFSLSVLESSD